MFYSTKYVLLDYILGEYEKGGGETVIIRKTRQQICEEIGLSANTIDRRLSSFRREGLISMERGKVSVSFEQYCMGKETLNIYRAENRNGLK